MKQILCFGDSNTWGYDPKTGERYAWGVRWTSILQEKLGTENAHIIEEGLCGRTTMFEDELREGRRGIDSLPFLLESHAPLDAIVLMLGTNDCKKIYRADETVIGLGIERLLALIRERQPQAKILLVSPIHLGSDVWRDGYDPEFDERAVAVSHRLKEVYQTLANAYHTEFPAASDCATYSQADMEHMEESGHRNLAEAIYEKLVVLIK